MVDVSEIAVVVIFALIVYHLTLGRRLLRLSREPSLATSPGRVSKRRRRAGWRRTAIVASASFVPRVALALFLGFVVGVFT